MRRSALQLARNLAAIAVLAFASSTASALTVNYAWTPLTGGGSGTITLTSNAISDAANFSGIDASALTGLTYTWDNGGAIDLLSIATNNVTTWAASGGYLINGFQITSGNDANTNAIGIYNLVSPAGLPGNPGVAASQINSGTFGAENNSGYWQLAPVPVPAAVWLFGSALAGLIVARRKAAA